ncbi:MAG: trigger factor [Deltaproteobacteria bacterium]|nr:trigger factor [Deltaproteobacteria bacterium]
MKFNIAELTSVQRQITVEVPAAEVDKTLDNIYKQLQRSSRLKGFRPGKAPRAVLERYYGPQAQAEAAESLLKDTFPKVMDESGLDPLAQPEFDFENLEPGQDFVYKLTFDVAPRFELAKEAYQGLSLKEPRLEVTGEEVDRRLELIRERQAILSPVEEERPAAIGDVVVVNYQSFDGDAPVEGGEAENVDIELGKGQVPQEIEVALVKTKPGDIVEATVNYDENAGNPKLQGKAIRFKLFVKELKQKILPSLDDDFARSLSAEFADLASLRERLTKDLTEMYGEQKKGEMRKQIVDHIRDLGEFDIPSSLVESELDQMVDNFKSRLKNSGMDPEAAGLDDSKLREDFREQASKKIRAGIVLGRIAELEEVEVTEEDTTAELQKISDKTGQPLGAIRDIYNKNKMMPELISNILQEKTLQAIQAGANIEVVEPSELTGENPA